ncbi:Crp/Fnr family transcriptional regulator [Bacillus sp. JJ722]|uniref:Crp/Fnr family transcriptional regulator n=1 Tax=Bacillus sp. JJ722 TaxID=3122973 RepID=UPI003000380B
MNQSDEIIQNLKKFNIDGIFKNINQDFFQLTLFKKGELICDKGFELDRLFIVVEGKVKIYTTTPDGKKLIIRFKNPIAIIGDIELIQNIEAQNAVEACTEVRAISLSFDVIKQELLNDFAFMNFLLENATHNLFMSTNFTSLNLLYPAEVRVASYLLSITTDGTGKPINDEIDFTSISDLADYVGSSYRHIIRILQKFTKENIIERRNGRIIVKDSVELRKRAINNIYE